MMVARGGEAEQLLQQHMHRCGGIEVAAAHHMGDPLERVVDDDGDVIRGRPVAPDQQHVAEGARCGFHRLFRCEAAFLPGERAGRVGGLLHVEAERMARAGVDQRPRFGRIALAVGGRIERRSVRVARPLPAGRGGLDLAAAHEGRIDQSHRRKPVDRRPVVGDVLRLAAHRLLPGKPQPAELVADRRFVFRPAAGGIGVLDPEQEAPAGRLGEIEVGQCRQGMAEMERAGGRGGEAENGLHWLKVGLIA